jgi:hypothetical protein
MNRIVVLILYPKLAELVIDVVVENCLDFFLRNTVQTATVALFFGRIPATATVACVGLLKRVACSTPAPSAFLSRTVRLTRGPGQRQNRTVWIG